MAGEKNLVDYHRFVFNGGQLVGEFDEMYRRSTEVPWHQDRKSRSVYVRVSLDILQYLEGPVRRVLEVGSGLGYIAEQLAENHPEVVGVELSAEAVRQARARVTGVQFMEHDVTAAPLPFADGEFDLVVIKDLLWYVLDYLETVFAEIVRVVREGGYVLVVQTFPDLDKPFVGREVFAGPAALARYLAGRLAPEYVLVHYRDIDSPEGQVLTFLGRRGLAGNIYARSSDDLVDEI